MVLDFVIDSKQQLAKEGILKREIEKQSFTQHDQSEKTFSIYKPFWPKARNTVNKESSKNMPHETQIQNWQQKAASMKLTLRSFFTFIFC